MQSNELFLFKIPILLIYMLILICDIAFVKMTLKDHKPVGENGAPRTRPVVSGNQGMNSHFNNIISGMLQQIGKEAEVRIEVISAEHMLQKIDELNAKLAGEKTSKQQKKYKMKNPPKKKQNKIKQKKHQRGRRMPKPASRESS